MITKKEPQIHQFLKDKIYNFIQRIKLFYCHRRNERATSKKFPTPELRVYLSEVQILFVTKQN